MRGADHLACGFKDAGVSTVRYGTVAYCSLNCHNRMWQCCRVHFLASYVIVCGCVLRSTTILRRDARIVRSRASGQSPMPSGVASALRLRGVHNSARWRARAASVGRTPPRPQRGRDTERARGADPGPRIPVSLDHEGVITFTFNIGPTRNIAVSNYPETTRRQPAVARQPSLGPLLRIEGTTRRPQRPRRDWASGRERRSHDLSGRRRRPRREPSGWGR